MKEIEVDGKYFDTHCEGCPYLLSFNRRIADKKDVVTVTCHFLNPECDLVKKQSKESE